jgi:MFS transporter, MHS family, shikimate and dehydroshikimate transport protein
VARRQPERIPALEVLRRQPRKFFVLLGARMAENGLGYLYPFFGRAYVTHTLGMPRQLVLDTLMLSFLAQLIAVPLFSMLSDRRGRRPVYIFGTLFGIVLAFPILHATGNKELVARTIGDGADQRHRGGRNVWSATAYFAELFGPKIGGSVTASIWYPRLPPVKTAQQNQGTHQMDVHVERARSKLARVIRP